MCTYWEAKLVKVAENPQIVWNYTFLDEHGKSAEEFRGAASFALTAWIGSNRGRSRLGPRRSKGKFIVWQYRNSHIISLSKKFLTLPFEMNPD
jgi:hypothetical protein